MTRAEILAIASPVVGGKIYLASDTGTFFAIPDGGDGSDAVALVTSNPRDYTGVTPIENLIGITQAGYDAIPVPNANTKHEILDAAGPVADYYAPGAALTSSASIAWDVEVTRQAKLTLAHNTTITLSNLNDGQSVSLSGIMGGAGSFTVALAHSGLTVRQMGAPLADIATLAADDIFEISIKRSGTDLRFWVSTLEI